MFAPLLILSGSLGRNVKWVNSAVQGLLHQSFHRSGVFNNLKHLIQVPALPRLTRECFGLVIYMSIIGLDQEHE